MFYLLANCLSMDSTIIASVHLYQLDIYIAK